MRKLLCDSNDVRIVDDDVQGRADVRINKRRRVELVGAQDEAERSVHNEPDQRLQHHVPRRKLRVGVRRPIKWAPEHAGT